MYKGTYALQSTVGADPRVCPNNNEQPASHTPQIRGQPLHGEYLRDYFAVNEVKSQPFLHPLQYFIVTLQLIVYLRVLREEISQQQ